MSSQALSRIFGEFEIHSPSGIRACFQQGLDANATVDGKPLIYGLINMYLRSPRFSECVRVFVENGLVMQDQALLSVLLDAEPMLRQALKADPAALHRTYSLDGTFTPLWEASLLHICAEYNLPACGRLLLESGVDVNQRAGVDAFGFEGQTPIFHTVNQHENNSMEMLTLLLQKGADLDLTVRGLIWGKGYSWETFIPSVNPISYAMMGLLRQFQRKESQIYEVVQKLMKARYGLDYTPANIPNAYLYPA